MGFIFKCYLTHVQECTITIKSDKARTASVLNGLKNDPSHEFIGEVIFKIKFIKSDNKTTRHLDFLCVFFMKN